MHLVKLIVLVLLVLTTMRCFSWGVLWLLMRLSALESRTLCLLAEIIGLVAFSVVLILDRLPGELIDLRAFTFGCCVFSLFFGLDLKWIPKSVGRPPHA